MKLAILADIHSNFHAFQAVLEDVESWGPDKVIAAGDTINRGPRPLECMKLINGKVETSNWIILRGNHEEYVLFHDEPEAPRNGPEFEVHLASFWTYKKLTTIMTTLRGLPLTYRLSDPNGGEVRVTHASMGGIRDGIYPSMPEEKLRKKIGDPPVVFCVGHTHIPLTRRLDGTLVVNAGSAGLPFDGNTNPSYARLTWQKGMWEAEIVRVVYDLEQAVRDYFTTRYLTEAGPLARLVLLELQQARSHLYQWAANYQEHVLTGNITMQQSVDHYLRNHL